MSDSKYPSRQDRSKLLARDISESLGKLPPQAIDLEITVLGALMLEKHAIINVAGFLHPRHFYTEQHREIFQAIQDLFSEGEPTDMRMVISRLRKNGKIEIVGGAYYIGELTSKVSSAANIEYHARIILEMAMKRGLIELASNIHHDAYEDTTDVFTLIEKSNYLLQEVLDNAITGRAEKKTLDIAVDVVKELESRVAGLHSGIDSGFNSLDAILNGFHPTDLIIVAARPGMGKTALVVQSAKNIAERGIPVAIFSLEMGSKQLIERLAIAESEIESDKIKKGKVDPLEFRIFSDACGKLSKLPLYIDDTAMLSIVELRARCMRLKAKHGIQLIVIDYLQLVRGVTAEGKGMNRDQEIGMITRTLKGIAKELEIPVIAISQLSRGVETRGGDKRPQLSDLRESGSIEQDADIVFFLYRPEYYKITQDSEGFPTNGLCEVIIAKHRNGALDTAKLKFIGKFTKFTDWLMESNNQEQYVQRHYKDPTQKLDKSAADFDPETTDSPF